MAKDVKQAGIDEKVEEILQKTRKGLFIGLAFLFILALAFITYFYIQHRSQNKSIARLLDIEEEIKMGDSSVFDSELALELSEFAQKNVRWVSAKAALLVSDYYLSFDKMDEAFQILQEPRLKKASYMAPILLFNAASLAEDLGNSKRALELYEDCYRLYGKQFSEAPRLLFSIGRIKERTGDSIAAREAYEELIAEWPNDEFANLAQSRVILLDGASEW